MVRQSFPGLVMVPYDFGNAFLQKPIIILASTLKKDLILCLSMIFIFVFILSLNLISLSFNFEVINALRKNFPVLFFCPAIHFYYNTSLRFVVMMVNWSCLWV